VNNNLHGYNDGKAGMVNLKSALVYFKTIFYAFLHCALSLATQCIVIGPVCGWVCGCVCGRVCLCVCYHDNSKLRASILTKLGL